MIASIKPKNVVHAPHSRPEESMCGTHSLSLISLLPPFSLSHLSTCRTRISLLPPHTRSRKLVSPYSPTLLTSLLLISPYALLLLCFRRFFSTHAQLYLLLSQLISASHIHSLCLSCTPTPSLRCSVESL